MKIPVNTPLLSGNEKKYLQECIDTEWISSEGPFVQRFENEFSKYIGKEYGVAVSSGSAALDVAVAALGIGKGDEVIVPTFTIISPLFSVLKSGAKPVLIDSDPATWNMDVDQIESKITSKTKAIIAVHIYGLPVDMDPIIYLCNKYNLKLIEDAAEMHGQTYKGKKCGTFGDISVFSFYPNKLITTGEGGMCLTDSEKLAKRCRKLRNLSFEENKRFVHYDYGWNYRITNMQAAIGLAQLENIDMHIQKKKDIGRLYRTKLEGIGGFSLPLHKTEYSINSYWVFGLLAESEELKLRTINKLSENGIGTRPFFWCMHEQPVFSKTGLFKGEKYPNAEKLARNGFYLPSGIGLDISLIDLIVKLLHG